MRAYMERALELAKRGLGKTSPNPAVGAVIVKNDKIIGEGYHQKPGAPHAEKKALSASDSEDVDGATLYVTLEPCCHFGKTPPCTEAIIESGIQKVVCAMKDPNPEVDGKGIQILRENDIQVEVGICEKEAVKINESYIKFVTENIPFVTLKIAQTLDGKIAHYSGDSKWITSKEARTEVHKLRAQYDAILVGRNTLDIDNPRLTVRHVEGESPHRFILTNRGELNPERMVFTDGESATTVLTQSNNVFNKEIETEDVDIWKFNSDEAQFIHSDKILKLMGKNDVTSLLIEGGRGVFSFFLEESAVDKIIFFISNKLMGKGIGPFDKFELDNLAEAPFLRDTSVNSIGKALKIEGYIDHDRK